jgi:hypothetical protein
MTLKKTGNTTATARVSDYLTPSISLTQQFQRASLGQKQLCLQGLKNEFFMIYRAEVKSVKQKLVLKTCGFTRKWYLEFCIGVMLVVVWGFRQQITAFRASLMRDSYLCL